MDDRMESWAIRQKLLETLLKAHGAAGQDWRVDLAVGRFWWQDKKTGKPSVVARTKVLCSWALSNGSLLAGWANASLPASAAVERVHGIAERDSAEEEGEAWAYALAIADGAGAEFVYRAPNAQMWIFLGLWDVRTAGREEAPFEAGPPWDHVKAVLDALVDMDDEEGLRTLAANYGRTFVESHVTRGTRWEQPLREIGEKLRHLTNADLDELRAGVRALREDLPTADA